MTALWIGLAIAATVALLAYACGIQERIAARIVAPDEPEPGRRLILGDAYVDAEFAEITEQLKRQADKAIAAEQWVDTYLTSDSPIEEDK